MERGEKESNRLFYNTRRDEDRRRFAEQGSKQFAAQALLRFVAPRLKPGELLLDVGGGSGAYASLIARESGATVVGVDISESMVRQRRADPSLQLNVVGDMEALPFADASFDAVLFVAALHHVQDALPALREAWRVLAPGGLLFAREPTSLRAGRARSAPIPGHPEEYRISMAYLQDRLRDAGFELDELLGTQLSMRLLGRLVSSPSLRLYRAASRLDELVFLVPGLRRLGEVCLVRASKPGLRTTRDPRENLLELLACPACGGELAEGGTSFSCTGCGKRYGISDSLPILLVSEPPSAPSGS